MKMKKAMAGVFAGIVAVSAMATSAISVNAAETTQTEKKATVDFDSASTSWVFSAKGRMVNEGQLATNIEDMASFQKDAAKDSIIGATGALNHTFNLNGGAVAGTLSTFNFANMTQDAMVTVSFPMEIEDLKITFTGTKAGTTNKTVTSTVTPKQKNAGNWAYYTIGVGRPVDGGKSQNMLNLSDFNLAGSIDFKVTGKVYNKSEYRSAQDANDSKIETMGLYRPDNGKPNGGEKAAAEDYNKFWNIDGAAKDTGTLYSSSVRMTAEIEPDTKTSNDPSNACAMGLMQAVFGAGVVTGTAAADIAALGDQIAYIQSEYMDVSTNNYRTLHKDSKPYQVLRDSDGNQSSYAASGYWAGTGRYKDAKGLAFEDLKANLTRYVVDIVGNSKGSTLTFNMVRASEEPFTYNKSGSLDDFGWNFNGGKAADNFAIGINSQRTSAIQMSASASGNTDTSIEISWDKLVERSGLAVNALGLIDDIFIASDDPTYHIGSLDVYRPANTFEDLSAGEPTVDSEDTLSSVDTTVATSEAPVVTAPAVDTTAAPATTPTVTPNPGTGNAPIALAVIPVAIAAAAIIAKKRK